MVVPLYMYALPLLYMLVLLYQLSMPAITFDQL